MFYKWIPSITKYSKLYSYPNSAYTYCSNPNCSYTKRTYTKCAYTKCAYTKCAYTFSSNSLVLYN